MVHIANRWQYPSISLSHPSLIVQADKKIIARDKNRTASEPRCHPGVLLVVVQFRPKAGGLALPLGQTLERRSRSGLRLSSV